MSEISGKIYSGIPAGGCVPGIIPKDYDAGLFCGNISGSVYGRGIPEVDPYGDEKYIMKLAKDYLELSLLLHPAAVLCQGEPCLTYQVARGLKEEGVKVLAACSERIVEEKERRKTSTFVFRGFREY